MGNSKDNRPGDDALGMNAPIERRDFLNSALIASGAALLGSVAPRQLLAKEDWTGYGGIGDYRHSNGNTYEVMTQGHRIRDRVFEQIPPNFIDTGEVYDCVVIGGGISGLAAALFFQRETGSKRSCLVLDDHPIFGGEAKRNEFRVDGHRLMIHQGSAACFPPLAGTFLDEFYRSIGVDWSQFHYQNWDGHGPAPPIQTTPYLTEGEAFGFFFGAKFGEPNGVWLIDPWGKQLAGAPISNATRRELLNMRQPDRKAFVVHSDTPKQHGDAASRYLDSITLEQHLMETYSMSRATVRTFLSPVSGGGSGLGADVLSGYCDYAADVLLPWDYAKGAQMFPGGNAGIARQILKTLLPRAISGPATMAGICQGAVRFAALDRKGQPTRIRLNSTVVAVQHEGNPNAAALVDIFYTESGKTESGKLYRTKAKSAVMANGSWTTKHIVRDLPSNCREAYAQFHRAPCLMANVAVRNWRFLAKLGLTECRWFEGIGNYLAMRKVATLGGGSPTIDPDSPTVINLKILFSDSGQSLEAQVQRGRGELLATPFRTYEQSIREQFTAMFARSGFDANRDIAGIVLNRWGHAYLSPQPGFFFGRNGQPAPGEILRHHPYGRVAFANSDLSGIMDHRMSILEARHAVGQVAEKLV